MNGSFFGCCIFFILFTTTYLLTYYSAGSSVIGELVGGPLSDFWMARRARSLGHRAPPEHRLWLSYIGFAVAIAGFLTFGIRMQEIGQSYSISPIIGIGMAGFGNQLITTLLVTCKFPPKFHLFNPLKPLLYLP
jgi:hypothetical protein